MGAVLAFPDQDFKAPATKKGCESGGKPLSQRNRLESFNPIHIFQGPWVKETIKFI